MPAPDWVQDALDEDLDGDEEIVDAEELEEGKLAVVSTSKRGFVVRDRLMFSPKIWPFEIEFPASATNGSTPVASPKEQTTEPLPEAVAPETRTEEAEPADVGADLVPESDKPEAAAEEAPVPALGQGAAPDELTRLDGVGPARHDALNDQGVETFADLAKADTETLAGSVSVSPETVADWQRAVDLTRVHGIGPARASRLRDAGVQTLEDLARADTGGLAEHADVPEATVRGWQEAAGREVKPPEDLTVIDGIGETRAQELVQGGVTTLRALIEADPVKVAEALGVSEGNVETWQKLAVEVPDGPTDLIEVDGVGAARARQLIRLGYPDKATFADADPAKLADQLRVTEDTVAKWQADAKTE